MKVSEIYEILNQISPFELQDKWDNSGLQLGCMDDEFEKIYLSIDVDSRLVESIENNSLLILHHPLIFDGLKSINPSKFPSNLIYNLIKKDIKVISMHLNFDKSHMNRYITSEILGYEIKKCNEYECYFEPNKDFTEFAKEVYKKLNLDILKVVKAKDFIKTAAICTGSGGSLLKDIEVDCFLTGDIKYHTALEAKENNISLIEIDHYKSEVIFSKVLSYELKNKGLDAIIAKFYNPFSYIKVNP